MRLITGAFWIEGEGCVITVESDDGYFVGQDVGIFDSESAKPIIRTSIKGIEKMKGRKLREPRSLQLRGVPKGLIKQNMMIKTTLTPLG